MAISPDINDREHDKFVDVSNTPAVRVANADGTNIGSSAPSGSATFAEQQSQTTALQIMDDWDESDRAKANIIVGQAGVAAGAGAVSATVQRVVLATDTTVPNVTGNVAAGATDSGNPVKIGGIYNTSAPTLTNAQRGNIELDVNGNQKTREQYMPGYEDNTNNKAIVEHRYTSSGVIAADTLVKTGAGLIHTITFSCNDAAPTAGSLILYDNTTETGTQIFNHTFTTTPFLPVTVTLDVSFTTGIYAGFTTTADVNVVISYR